MTRSLLAVTLCTLVAFAAGCDSLLDPEPLGIEVIENQLATPEGAVPFVNGPLLGYDGHLRLLPGARHQHPRERHRRRVAPRAVPRRVQNTRAGRLRGGISPASGGTQLTAVSRINIYLDREGDIDWTGREELRSQLRGEALFLRGLYYFNLVRVFGDVPIYTDPALIVADVQAARNPTTEVYTRVKSDLSEAVSLLPDAYSGSGLGTGARARHEWDRAHGARQSPPHAGRVAGRGRRHRPDLELQPPAELHRQLLRPPRRHRRREPDRVDLRGPVDRAGGRAEVPNPRHVGAPCPP